MFTEAQRLAVFLEIHRAIEESATASVAALTAGDAHRPSYPPNGGLTPAEVAALRELSLSPSAASGLRKVLADTAAAPLFHFLALLDGVADPQRYPGEWAGVRLEPGAGPGAGPSLHDYLFESYWAWRTVRPDPGWRLDTLSTE